MANNFQPITIKIINGIYEMNKVIVMVIQTKKINSRTLLA